MTLSCILRKIKIHRYGTYILALISMIQCAAAEPPSGINRMTDADTVETGQLNIQQEAPPELSRRGTIKYRPAEQEDQVPLRFRLPAESFIYEVHPLDVTSKTPAVSLVTFPSAIVTPQPNNNTVHCEYYRPNAEGKRPGVVVLHILGGSFELSRICSRALASKGIGALFVKMPHYGPRRQPGSNARMISNDPHETVRGMTQAVLDVRRAAAWLAAREEIDPNQLGINGISLGGIVSALAFSAEPRFQKGCFVLAGGDLAETFWKSQKYSNLRERWTANGKNKEDLQELLSTIDPAALANKKPDRRILMFNARHDEVVPYSCTIKLWQAYGEPEIVWWNTGHYTAIWELPACLVQMSHFFNSESP